MFDIRQGLVKVSFDMNEIVIDLDSLPDETQQALKSRAVREGKPMKQLLAELINNASDAILNSSSEKKEEGK